MKSNPTSAGIYITTPSDYILSTGEISQISSGIMSLKAGGAFDIRSVGNMTIAAEIGNMEITTVVGSLSQIVATAWTSTTGQIWSHTSIGSTIHTSTTGNVNVSTPSGVIELN